MQALVVPDTNVLFSELRRLLSVIEPYRRNVVVGLPQIPIEESVHALYRLACGDERTDEFLRKLDEIASTIRSHGLEVIALPIPCILDISRLDLCYSVDEEVDRVLSEVLEFFVGRGRRYHSTLRQVLKCISMNIDPRIRPADAFYQAIDACCERHDDLEEQCREQCKTLFSALGDVLLLGSCYYALQFMGVPTILVSRDKTLQEVAAEVLKRKLGKAFSCVDLHELPKVVKYSLSRRLPASD